MGVLGTIFLTVAGLGVLYTVAAALALGWFMQRPFTADGPASAVTLLKPLHGMEPGLRERLEGFCRQDYAGAVQIVFGVRDAADDAIEVVRRLILDHPEFDIELVVDPRIWGANLKISNLINLQAVARHPIWVIADSDVGVESDYLRRVTAGLGDPTVGYVTCAFVGRATGDLWSRLAVMSIDHHFLPSVALGLRLGLAKPCFGPTMAFRRDVFERAGGFIRFADQLADDFAIGAAIRALGLGFVVPPMLVTHACPERGAREVWRHELRWARTIRLIDPLCYAASLVCHPALFALAAFALTPGLASGAMLGLVAASRLVVIARVARLTGGDAGLWWLASVRDLASAAVHVAAFFARTVEWRGRQFDVGAGGLLQARPARRAFEPAMEGLAIASSALTAPSSSAV